MRARYPRAVTLTHEEIRAEVSKEFHKQKKELQDEIQDSIARQLIAAVLYTLDKWEGYGTKRIKRVYDEIAQTFSDMSGVGFVDGYDTDDLIEYIKKKHGIDLVAEVECEPSKLGD